MSSTQTFYADAVLFDMDGTLTDSIQAVEAAWGKVAKDIGQDPQHVIAATHGKRAVDNLAQFKPHIKAHEMDDAVQTFEESILFFADAYTIHGPGSRTPSRPTTRSNSFAATPIDSGATTPALTDSSAPNSRQSSFVSSRRPSFGQRLLGRLNMTSVPIMTPATQVAADIEDAQEGIRVDDQVFEEESEAEKKARHTLAAWQLEATAVDRSVRILPGVKKIIESIPAGRYAVATSGAKTYAYGCMTRVGITPPPVTITADDKRLKAGKPAPDPFLLAAECLGYDAKKCVVFEDSPSGIRAGVASGATVIAVCTSHERSKIENCGAHYIVENMDLVQCEFDGERLRFSITA